MEAIAHEAFADVAAGKRPPRLPPVLNIGVTGHRSQALAAGDIDALRRRIGDVLQAIFDRADALRDSEPELFTDDPPSLVFVSPLADGADQISAEVALDLGFELHAVLPFERSAYRTTLEHGSLEGFDRLIERASRVLELPGEVEHPLEGYVLTGRASIAHSDLILAIWDGEPARGRGGTAEVVQLALVQGTPLVHIPVEPTEETRLLWSAFDPTVVTHDVDEAAARTFDYHHLDEVLRVVLAPPVAPEERQFLHLFQNERIRPVRYRIEYPLLLLVAGIKPIRGRDLYDSVCAEDIRQEWEGYQDACVTPNAMDPPLAILEEAYSWCDRLATYYAQTYRSGHIFNFVLGGLAVCIGLASNILNRGLLEFAIFEGLITAAIILNTWLGVRNEWHRRWLDYRQLAERLRPMRSLKLLGVATPDPPGTLTNPIPRRWIDWYASGIWRAMGCPAGSLTKEGVETLAKAIADQETAPQVAYHQRHAHRIELLDGRLERVASALFWITLIGSVAVLVGLVIAPDTINAYGDWFTLIGAGFPALATAVFGIRFQADFGGSAVRSLMTATTLAQIDSDLRRDIGLSRAADLTQQAARTMLDDLEEWRLVNQQQELDLL